MPSSTPARELLACAAGLALRQFRQRGASYADDHRQHDQRAEQETQSGKQKRSDRVETEALRDERGAPDHCRDQHEQVGAQVLACVGFQRLFFEFGCCNKTLAA
jgi:hypothetical protein